MTEKEKVTIGIPCYGPVPPEILDSYMRFGYHMGRREPEYDFFLAIKSKSEQFRARNAIVEAALQVDSQWLLMLDDDHILDNHQDLVGKLIQHLKDDPERGIVGALYAQRGSDYLPVVMREYEGGPSFMIYEDLSWQLQMVDITGGGCMMINMKLFDKIDSPWFAPEFEFGTDIQICRKAREAGFTVWCDTSISIGHLRETREIIEIKPLDRLEGELQFPSPNLLKPYQLDACEFSGKTLIELGKIGEEHRLNSLEPDRDHLYEYYSDLGIETFARNVWFHSREDVNRYDLETLELFGKSNVGRGVDHYCGSGPVGFVFARLGHFVVFCDANKYCRDFIEWRIKKYGLADAVVVAKLPEPDASYDFVLLLDAIEHMNPEGLEEEMEGIIGMLKVGGVILTNYFDNRDYTNPQHINMDKGRVRRTMVRLGLRAVTIYFWQKWR